MTTLRDRIRSEPAGLAEGEALALAAAVARGIAAARARGKGVASDLGAARMTPDGRLVLADGHSGVPLDPGEDVPALGRLLARLLRPTDEDPVMALAEATGAARARLVVAAAADPDPAARLYRDAGEFADAAERAGRHLVEIGTVAVPVAAPSSSAPMAVASPAGRSRVVVLVGRAGSRPAAEATIVRPVDRHREGWARPILEGFAAGIAGGALLLAAWIVWAT